jgi:hypothetical protein
MLLAECPPEQARPQPPARDEHGEVGNEHDGEKCGRGGCGQHPRHQQDCDERRGEADAPLQYERLPPQADAAGEQRAQPDHRREVERVRSDDDPEPDPLGAAGDRNDGRAQLRCVGGERRQQPEQRLREAEPVADPVEPARERRRREERDDERDEEERNRERGGNRLTSLPTSLPGAP